MKFTFPQKRERHTTDDNQDAEAISHSLDLEVDTMESADTAALLLLDLPQGALAGIDMLSFTTTPRFRGVKNIPSGLHFTFVGTSTAFSERHGLFFTISPYEKALIVAKWNAAKEMLLLEEGRAELLRWKANLGSIWKEGLTPYRQMSNIGDKDETTTETGDWSILTSSITERLLARILDGDQSRWRLSSASSAKGDLEDIPGLKSAGLASEHELHFLPIDLKQTWREGAVGRERTDAARDRSWALQETVEKHCDGRATEVVGEMQFCFSMILTINNFSCLEQWKRILTLIFTCRSYVAIQPDLFISAIAALRIQLQHCKDAEGGLIDLADESGSLLRSLLVRFRKGVENLSGIEVQHVVDELDDLEDYLQQEHGWQFGGTFAKSGLLELEDGEQVRMDTTAFDEDEEEGEFAPQVVELTPQQAKMLNMGDDSELHVSMSKTSLVDGEGSPSSSEESEAGDLDDMDARY